MTTPPHLMNWAKFTLIFKQVRVVQDIMCTIAYFPFNDMLYLMLDLTGLWNWNTKMLFVYMIATFETPTHVSLVLLLAGSLSNR